MKKSESQNIHILEAKDFMAVPDMVQQKLEPEDGKGRSEISKSNKKVLGDSKCSRLSDHGCRGRLITSA